MAWDAFNVLILPQFKMTVDVGRILFYQADKKRAWEYMRHLDSNHSCANKEPSLIATSITTYGFLTSQATEVKVLSHLMDWRRSETRLVVWTHVNTTVAL